MHPTLGHVDAHLFIVRKNQYVGFRTGLEAFIQIIPAFYPGHFLFGFTQFHFVLPESSALFIPLHIRRTLIPIEYQHPAPFHGLIGGIMKLQ